MALVTGASSGLGKATAEHFVAKGARVVLCDASTSNGAAVAAGFGKQALFVPTDLNSESDVSSLLAATEERFGALNVIVNCHSAPSPFTSPTYNFATKLPHSLEDFQKAIAVSASNSHENKSYVFNFQFRCRQDQSARSIWCVLVLV